MVDLGVDLACFALLGGLSVTRYAAGSYGSDGVYTPGATTALTINPAVVYVSTPKEILRLPEGQRTEEAITVFTREPLKTANDPSDTLPDVITYYGISYLVVLSEQWLQWGYYKSMAVKRMDA